MKDSIIAFFGIVWICILTGLVINAILSLSLHISKEGGPFLAIVFIAMLVVSGIFILDKLTE